MQGNRIPLNEFPGGFDDLLRHQLCLPPKAPKRRQQGLTVLIRGAAGTGKTTLALQIALYLAVNKECGNAMYYSLEQDADSLRHKLASMLTHQVEHAKLMGEKQILEAALNNAEMPRRDGQFQRSILKILQEGDYPLRFFEHSEDTPVAQLPLFSGNLERGTSIVTSLLDDMAGDRNREWPILAVDGLATVPASQRKVLGLDRLFDLIKQNCEIGIIVYEPTDEAEEQNLDHLVDMVIELREHPLMGSVKYLINEIHIPKARYQDPARGWHQYKIRNWGLEFFPSIHFQVQMPGYMPLAYKRSNDPLQSITRAVDKQETLQSGRRQSILEGLVHGMDDGSITVLLGSRGSFKSQLCIDFLTAGALDNRHGLFISLIDNFKNLNEHMLCPRLLCEEKCDDEHNCRTFIHLFHQRPGCITPAEFLHYMKKRLDVDNETRRLDRLLFWDLTQLDYRFPMLIDDNMFIPGLLDTFKFRTANPSRGSLTSPENRPLRSVIMGAGNAKCTRAVSAMADNVLCCWRDSLRRKGKKRKLRNPYADPQQMKDELQLEVKDSQLPAQYLLIYVDRRERHHGTGSDSLYAFPLTKATLRLPRHRWTPSVFSTKAEHFADAQRNIQMIHQQQGLE